MSGNEENEDNVELLVCNVEEITFTELLRAVPTNNDLVALLYGATRFDIARVEAGALVGFDRTRGGSSNGLGSGSGDRSGDRSGHKSDNNFGETQLTPTLYYEARVFGPDFELRWLMDDEDGSVGQAAIVGSSVRIPPELRGFGKEALKCMATELDCPILLWGGAGPSEGVGCEVTGDGRWACLEHTRIGKIWVPVSAAQDRSLTVSCEDAGTPRLTQAVQLCHREYIGVDGSTELGEHGNASVLADRLVRIELGEILSTDPGKEQIEQQERTKHGGERVSDDKQAEKPFKPLQEGVVKVKDGKATLAFTLRSGDTKTAVLQSWMLKGDLAGTAVTNLDGRQVTFTVVGQGVNMIRSAGSSIKEPPASAYQTNQGSPR